MPESSTNRRHRVRAPPPKGKKKKKKGNKKKEARFPLPPDPLWRSAGGTEPGRPPPR